MADDSTDTITGLMSGIPDIIKKIPGLLNQAPAAAKAIGGRLLEAAPYAALVPALAQGDQGAFALAASMQENKRQSAERARAREGLGLLAQHLGLLKPGEPLPAGVEDMPSVAAWWKMEHPATKKWVPMGKGGMFNIETQQVVGAPTATDIPKGPLEKRQWLLANENDPRAPMVRKALDEDQAARIEAARGTTEARTQGKRAATKIGDTKDYWIAREGPLAGQKLPGDTPESVAPSIGTKLNANEAKMYENTSELLGWMGELGVSPDGQISPEGQARIEQLYAKDPTFWQMGKAATKRNLAWMLGDKQLQDSAQTLEQVVSILTTQFAKATAGTLRVNQSELRLIKAAHPEPKDTAATAIDKLKRITRYATEIRRRMIGGALPPPENAPPFATPLPGLLSPGASTTLNEVEDSAFGGNP